MQVDAKEENYIDLLEIKMLLALSLLMTNNKN